MGTGHGAQQRPASHALSSAVTKPERALCSLVRGAVSSLSTPRAVRTPRISSVQAPPPRAFGRLEEFPSSSPCALLRCGTDGPFPVPGWLPPESVPFLTPEPVTGTASVGCSRMVRKHIAHSLRGFEWIQSLFSVLCANAFERAGTHSGGCCLTDRSRWWALMKGMLVQVIPAARGPHTTGYC